MLCNIQGELVSTKGVQGELVCTKGVQADTHSNNEAKYSTLEIALCTCIKYGVHHLCIRGDAFCVVKQVLRIGKAK